MKKVVIYLLFLTLVSSGIFVACSKSNVDQEWKATLGTNSYSSAAEIFKSINKIDLKNATSTNNIKATQEIIYPAANKIASYFFDRYKIDIRQDFVDNPQGIIILGLFYAAKEVNYSNNSVLSSLRVKTLSSDGLVITENKDDFSCFLSAVAAVIGITDARNIWRSIVSGASEETVLAAVKLIGKRVAGVISVAIMVYEVGSCLEWW